MEVTTVKDFYKEVYGNKCPIIEQFLKDQNGIDLGHFNVFKIEDFYCGPNGKPAMPYNRRTYYKISLINGQNLVEFADKEINIASKGVLFASPKIPYRYTPLDSKQSGYFCVFTADFMDKTKTAIQLDALPIFNSKGDFVFQINDQEYEEMEVIFEKMQKELSSDYPFKYDLIRNYVIELIHTGQKLKPIESATPTHNAASRISTLFIELLERQFPISSPAQELKFRTAKEYADTLSVHVNHLNKVLKDVTGRTTTEIIASRITQEAKFLLKQTDWNVSEIAISLGFDEVAHFSNFFKKQTQVSPLTYRA